MSKDKPTKTSKTTKPTKPVDYKSLYQQVVTTNVKDALAKLQFFYVTCDKGHIFPQPTEGKNLISLDIVPVEEGLAFCLIVNEGTVGKLNCQKCKKEKTLEPPVEPPVMDSAKK